MSSIDAFRASLSVAAPCIWGEIEAIVGPLVAPAIQALREGAVEDTTVKVFNDPVWGGIEFEAWEVAILDSPLLQRLGGVRQLGLSHKVYPGASHTRLEHTRGVVEASDRILASLERKRRRRSATLTEPSTLDRVSIRLGAILHDVSHGPCSHVTETVIESLFRAEFKALDKALRHEFKDVLRIAPAESLAVAMIMTEAMKPLFEALAPVAGSQAAQLPGAVCARILGSKKHLKATYLAGILSGPLDADKMDYMARDCHHTGLSFGLDIRRLIATIDIVDEPGKDPSMGVTLAGIGAYEQFVVARVLLYDRLYYHHKVRAAESMLARLIKVRDEEADERLRLRDFYLEVSDDAFVGLLGGDLGCASCKSGGVRSIELSRRLNRRNLYQRTYAIASRYDARLEALSSSGKDEAVNQWNDFLDECRSDVGRAEIEQAIYDRACALGGMIPDLSGSAALLQRYEIVLDLPPNKVIANKGEILTRSGNGVVHEANLFFSPDKWSRAYEDRKRQGFVYTPRPRVPLVSLASRIVMYERFGLHMGRSGDEAAKVSGVINPDWIRRAIEVGLCEESFARFELDRKTAGLPITAAAIVVPDPLQQADPNFASTFVESLREALPQGVPVKLRTQYIKAINESLEFVRYAAEQDTFVKIDEMSERDLQAFAKAFLLARQNQVVEGSERAGGETDLTLFENVIVENKIFGETDDPMSVKENAGWQARRYTLPLGGNLFLVFVAYKPASEKGVLPLSQRIRVIPMQGSPEPAVEIRMVLPYGHSLPSRAKGPKTV